MTQKTRDENLVAIEKLEAIIELLRDNEIVVDRIRDSGDINYKRGSIETRELYVEYWMVKE